MSQNKRMPQPPKWIDQFLCWRLPKDQFEEVQGDLHELYGHWIQEVGERKAKWLYALNAFTFLRPLPKSNKAFYSSYSYYSHANYFDMIRNYLKIACRHIVKQKTYSFINIAGLSIGMTVAMLIGLWIYDELSFNKYHQNYDRIAHIMRHFTIEGEKGTGGQSSPMPLSNELRSSFGSDFTHIVMSTWPQDYIISNGDKKFTQKGRFMEPGAPDMLTLHMLHGSRSGLGDRHSILLSETLSKKLFGEADALHKMVMIDTRVEAKVTGVYQDLPLNSAFSDVSYIAPFDLFVSFNGWAKNVSTNWWDNSFPVYVQIAPHTTFNQVSAKIKNVFLPHMDEQRTALKPEAFLHPMSKWHLYSRFENGINATSEELKFVLFYGVIGLFVLLLACINFMNLSTARSATRAKEIGIRKTVGSLRSQLIGQFLSESMLIAAFALVTCLGLVYSILPLFNEIAHKQLSLLWNAWRFWLAAIAFTVFTALLAGSYPAFYLSALEPVKVLKGVMTGIAHHAFLRKVLVVFQFTISIALIIGTLVVYQQIEFAKNRPIGYDSEGLLYFPKYSTFEGKTAVLRDELLQTGVVYEVAESASKLTQVYSNNSDFKWKDKDPAVVVDFGTLGISHEYGKTIGWHFVEGRDFLREFTSDSAGFIINESAAKVMGLQNPVGEVIKSNLGWHQGKSFKVLGVVKDVVMESPFEPVKPTLYFLQGQMHWIFVRINAGVPPHEALPKIEAVFKKIIPSAPFDYGFVDGEYAKKFAREERTSKLAGFFAILAILISCLGLFGLASFVVERRTKEIGIRKVLGANIFSVWGLLSKEFVLLVTLAFLIATPVCIYVLTNWLENYEYRTELPWWTFAITGAGALLITLFTVSFQAIKAALTNPVKSLRSE